MKGLVTFEHRDMRARVLVLTNMWPNDDRPDYGVFVKRQVDSLIERGLRCDVVFIRGYRSRFAYVAAAARLALWNLLPSRRYLLVHGHGGEVAITARFYARAPVVISYCGDDLLGTPRADGTISLPHRVRRGVLRVWSRLLTGTVTKSREMEDALPRSVAARNRVIPNGVDRSHFCPREQVATRQLLGWASDDRVALFAANPAVDRKRFWLAEAAVEIARERNAAIRLEVASGVAPEKMPELLSAADCLLLTSSIEGSPNVVKEALMCGLPVISTPVGDVHELLADVEPSWIRDSDPAALAEALVECMETPRRSNGRVISVWLGADAIAGRVLSYYEDLAPGSATDPAGVSPSAA